MEDRYGGVSKSYICPVCQNRYQIPFQTKGGGRIQWVFKRKQKGKTIYYCSYHCFKASEAFIEGGSKE